MVYKNGNTIVKILEDGTKIRYVRGCEKPAPEFPESIDIKISDRCDMQCVMCHEKSDPDGDLADLHHPLLESIHPGTELAIGGGNPLEHPELENFLRRMKDQGVICNMTVHWMHFIDAGNFYDLMSWQKNGMIHGLGISVTSDISQIAIDMSCSFNNVVFHTIAGLTTMDTMQKLYGHRILILGFKDYGRGRSLYTVRHRDINRNIEKLELSIIRLIPRYKAVSFDNLALDQLGMRVKLGQEDWEKFYMGGDGEYTMYVDLVKNEFARSSISDRKPINSRDIRDLFKEVKKQ